MALLAIRKLVRDEEPTFAAHFHAHQAGIPAGDDAVRTDREGWRKRRPVIERRVEFLSIRCEPASVLDGKELHGSGHFASTDLYVDIFQGVGSVHHAMGRRDVLGQRGAARCGVVGSRCRLGWSRLGTGSGRRSQGENGEG
jgi:hypothetical protein